MHSRGQKLSGPDYRGAKLRFAASERAWKALLWRWKKKKRRCYPLNEQTSTGPWWGRRSQLIRNDGSQFFVFRTQTSPNPRWSRAGRLFKFQRLDQRVVCNLYIRVRLDVYVRRNHFAITMPRRDDKAEKRVNETKHPPRSSHFLLRSLLCVVRMII